RLPESADESGAEEPAEPAVEPYADVSEPPDAHGDAQPGAVMAAASELPADVDSAIELSIVVPAYNEEARLPKTLLSTYEYFHAREMSYEIIVVDDGSSDETGHVVRQFETLTPTIRLLTYPTNRGKGYAVRFGVLNARGRLVLFMDADGATPI